MNWGATHRLQQFWDIRAACNFIGGGTGSGLLVWASLGLIAGLPYAQSALVGLVLVAAGLFMVWLEIGKPWRAFNLFFRPQTSWMTREGIVALPLFAAGALSVFFAADLALLPTSVSAVVPAMLTATFSLAFLYCQLRILHSARSLPAWREPWAMPLLGLSGLTEGLGLYLLATAILGIVSMVFVTIAATMIVARTIAWHAYVAALTRSGAPEPTVAALIDMRAGFLIAGHALPILLIVFAYIWPHLAIPLTALAGAAATLGGWYLKIVLVTRAAYIPKIVVPTPPVRGRRGSPGGVL
jgi:phenylacetyl-CoA:acceptor oxidoreductase subunit 2